MADRYTWGMVLALFSMSVLAFTTLGILIWRSSSIDAEPCTVQTKLHILFPGYFRTKREQYWFKRQYLASSSPPETFKPENCEFDCPFFAQNNNSVPDDLTTVAVNDTRPKREVSTIDKTTHVRKRRDPDPDDVILSGPVYHGCCVTWRLETRPLIGVTIGGMEVELVQTANHSQYFIEEYCEQVDPCSGCTCETQPHIETAVYYKDKNATNVEDIYDIAWIVLDGCCKCLNIV